jgi:hypothetical protein
MYNTESVRNVVAIDIFKKDAGNGKMGKSERAKNEKAKE